MGKAAGLLKGIKTLEQRVTKFNGEVTVVRSFAFGTYIQVDGLTQSGGVVDDIWRTTLKKIRRTLTTNHQSLILGLGGGSAARRIKKNWPEAKITGVEIDPVMVEMGKKYLGLDKLNIDIKVEDAYEFTTENSKLKTKYDLILVDIYLGDEYPEKFESGKFLNSINNLLTESGVAVFNRLYFREKRPLAVKFGQKLEKIFPEVEYFYPEANLILICSKKG